MHQKSRVIPYPLMEALDKIYKIRRSFYSVLFEENSLKDIRVRRIPLTALCTR